MPSAYFLDTSALLPRCLRRAAGHSWVEGICGPSSQNAIVLAEVTEAELAAAMNQLVRGGILKRKQCDDALLLFWNQVDANEFGLIAVTSTIVRQAADLCGVHALKGYDAIQLSCALAAREVERRAAASGTAPADPIFLTEDTRLMAAAQAEGFVVDSPANHP